SASCGRKWCASRAPCVTRSGTIWTARNPRCGSWRCGRSLPRWWRNGGLPAAASLCPPSRSGSRPTTGRPRSRRPRRATDDEFRPERSMDRSLVLLNRNIARLRRDVRLQSSEIEQLIAADLDCTPAAQRLMRAQADLVLYIEKRERLVAPAARD